MPISKTAVALLAFLLIVDIGLRLIPRSSAQVDFERYLVPVARAQNPVLGTSLLPRYIITSNQAGDVIYVWEDEGKGYIAKAYGARR